MTYSFLRADFRFSSSMSSWIPLSLESSRRFNVCSRMARLCGCCWAWDNTETSGISSSFYKQEQNYTAHEYNIYIILDNTDKLKIFGLWFASPMLVNALPTELRSHVCMFNVGRALYTSKLKSRVQFPPSSMLVNALPTELRSHVSSMSVQCWQSIVY
jgi:hypothetical protein